MAHAWAQQLRNSYRLRGPKSLQRGTKSQMAHMWAQGLRNPCRLMGPQCSARGQNHKWPMGT